MKARLKAITMRNFLRAVWRLRFKRRDGTAKEAHACHLSDVEICRFGKFAGKPQQYSPEKGWRLLDRIICTIPPANTDNTYDMQFDESVLERIDFLACLFGTGKTE